MAFKRNARTNPIGGAASPCGLPLQNQYTVRQMKAEPLTNPRSTRLRGMQGELKSLFDMTVGEIAGSRQEPPTSSPNDSPANSLGLGQKLLPRDPDLVRAHLHANEEPSPIHCGLQDFYLAGHHIGEAAESGPQLWVVLFQEREQIGSHPPPQIGRTEIGRIPPGNQVPLPAVGLGLLPRYLEQGTDQKDPPRV
jgi:hypothetical protein